MITPAAQQQPLAAAQPLPAHAWFFPAAALYAALIVPLSLLAMSGRADWASGLAHGLGHAHEMLFGFALAVVAGYLLGPQPAHRLLALFVLWLAARLAFFMPLLPWLAATLNTMFAVALAAVVAPKFLSAAKKLRNQAFAPVLIGICVTVVAYQLAVTADMFWLRRTALLEAVLLFALLMLFMGGRIIAPAVAGAFYRQGMNLEARVQPRIEGALILLLAVAVLSLAVPPGRWLAALALLAAGVLSLVRLLRWRLWACRGRPDLICLGVGYGWIGLGLVLVGAALAADAYLTVALHAITVGALGTLSSGVMARLRLQRAKQDPAKARSIVVSAALMSLAVLSRALGGLGFGSTFTWYWLAAAAWSLGFLLLLHLLWRVPAR